MCCFPTPTPLHWPREREREYHREVPYHFQLTSNSSFNKRSFHFAFITLFFTEVMVSTRHHGVIQWQFQCLGFLQDMFLLLQQLQGTCRGNEAHAEICMSKGLSQITSHETSCTQVRDTQSQITQVPHGLQMEGECIKCSLSLWNTWKWKTIALLVTESCISKKLARTHAFCSIFF